MATIRKRKKATPTKITKFLGLREDSAGNTSLKLGESPYMRNYKITENYKLMKREGYTKLFDSLGSENIHGIWYGKLSSTYYFLFIYNTTLYKHNLSTGINTSIGTVTASPTTFFAYNDKVYMLNGTNYKSYDGSTLSVVGGYRPKIYIGCLPSGGGTPYEEINLLTGAKEQTFDGDGTSTVYQLAETNIDSIDNVYVDGVLKTVTVDYTVNLTNGTVTFGVAPTNFEDNVEIEWTKASASNRALINNMKYAMIYGGSNDTRIHLWGDSNNKNIIRNTGLANGVPSAEYFPALGYRLIGSDEFAVTDVVKQYDRQIIFTEKEIYWSYYELIDSIASFPLYHLNDSKGNIAPNQTRIINNSPVFVFDGVYELTQSNVRDERNVSDLSDRVQYTLDQVDLSTAITYDFEKNKEYWLNVGSIVWIYNYGNNTWYKYDNISATCFLEIDGELYFGDSDGTIHKFDVIARTDNGTLITDEWRSHFYDFKEDWLRKYLDRIWIGINPQDKSLVNIELRTDNKGVILVSESAKYNLATFDSMDFEDFSFLVSYNPQPFRFKVKAKKFTWLQVILKSQSTTYTATINNLDLKARYGGESK